MNGDETGYIPTSLDARERFLWWEIDQLVLAVMIFGVGLAIGAALAGLIFGPVSAWLYGRMKAGRHPRFAIHVLYWWLPGSLFIQPKSLPPSGLRYFLG